MKKNDLMVSSMLYRMQKLDEKYEQLKDLVRRTDGSYLTMILTKMGQVSEQALDHLIDELMACLSEYRTYQAAFHMRSDEEVSVVFLTEQEERFYRSFFYLLFGLCTERHNGPEGRWEKPGTWNAILERVSIPVGSTGMPELDRELLLYSLKGMPVCIPGGIFYDISDAFPEILGEPVSSLVGQTERQAAYARMSQSELAFMQDPGKKEQQDLEDEMELQAAFEELFPDDLQPDLTEEEFRQIMREDIACLEYLEEDDHTGISLNTFFADRERFRGSCQAVHDLYFDGKIFGNLETDVRNCVLLFLCKIYNITIAVYLFNFF